MTDIDGWEKRALVTGAEARAILRYSDETLRRLVNDGKAHVKGYTYDPGNGTKIPLEPWEICHFKTFNPHSRFVGLSELAALMLADIPAACR